MDGGMARNERLDVTTTSRRRQPTAVQREVYRKPGDERWQEILETSARMFASHGYAATSLQMIADDLGLLKGSLYYYINSKEDLLYEVIKDVYVPGVANFQLLASGTGDAATRLRNAVEGHVVYLIENLASTTVYLHEYDRLSAQRRAELGERDYVKLVRDLIIEGQEEGAFRDDLDPHLAAMSVLGSTNWIYRWYQPGSRGPRDIGRELAVLVVQGMLAPGASP